MHLSIHQWKNEVFTVRYWDMITGLPVPNIPALGIGTLEEARDLIQKEAKKRNVQLTRRERTPTIESTDIIEVWMDLSPI